MAKKKILASLALVSLAIGLTACNKDETKTTNSDVTTVAPTTDNAQSSVTQNASYTIGYGLGANIANDPNLIDSKLDQDTVIKGFKDALTNQNPQISEDEIDKNIQDLGQKISKKMNADSTNNFLKNKNTIANSPLTPKTDTKDPQVAVYEFFDYQCMYCAKVYPELEKLMENNKNVQFVFVEFPIFGQRAPSSEYAAEVGTAVYKLYGANAYVKYHNAIFASGEDEGKLQNSTIDKAAQSAGANITDVKAAIKNDKIAQHLQDTLKLGNQELGIQGTPYLVVAPVNGANADNTTVIAGYTQADNIQKAIDNAMPEQPESANITTNTDVQKDDNGGMADTQVSASDTQLALEAADSNNNPAPEKSAI